MFQQFGECLLHVGRRMVRCVMCEFEIFLNQPLHVSIDLYKWRFKDDLFDRMVSHTKHVWYSEHGMYCRFEIILERAMSATHIAVIPCTRTSPAYEEEFTKMDYPDARNEYGTL